MKKPKTSLMAAMFIPWALVLLALFLDARGETLEPLSINPDLGGPPVGIDPRVELISIIFRLAGSPEYNLGTLASYNKDIEEHFGRFKSHPAVKMAIDLRESQRIGYNAPMDLAIHMADVLKSGGNENMSSLPGTLDERWTRKSVKEFTAEVRRFARDTQFKEFFEQHRVLYEVAQWRLKKVLLTNDIVRWVNDFFGEESDTEFFVVISMLNDGNFYASRTLSPEGKQDFYCVLGVGPLDNQGIPMFGKFVIPFIVHEFAHSYVNPLVDKHAGDLQAPGERIFVHVGEAMKKQAYSTWKMMLYESLVRACVVRYFSDDPETSRRILAEDEKNGFILVGGLSKLLSEYEANRRQYPELESFCPRIVNYLENVATQMENNATERELMPSDEDDIQVIKEVRNE